jgi:hypothetical protein
VGLRAQIRRHAYIDIARSCVVPKGISSLIDYLVCPQCVIPSQIALRTTASFMDTKCGQRVIMHNMLLVQLSLLSLEVIVVSPTFHYKLAIVHNNW